MIKCYKCHEKTEELFTNDEWKLVCRKCLEKEIYKDRHKRLKKIKKIEKSIYEERRKKDDYTDIIMLALILGLFGCILIIFGFILLITTPDKQPKGMSMNDCLEAVGDYKLCERKLNNGR